MEVMTKINLLEKQLIQGFKKYFIVAHNKEQECLSFSIISINRYPNKIKVNYKKLKNKGNSNSKN